MRRRYEGGLATALDALTAEDEMLATRHPVDDLRSRAFALDANLAKALGGGWGETTN
jgi:outer membrane protein TolC